MIVYPAIDLRRGRAVQLVGGDPAAERLSLPDPVAVAHEWVAAGFHALHLVDLDAALGLGSNRAVIQRIAAAVPVPVQAGGGIRDDAGVEALLEGGVARVLVGTRAVQDRHWLETAAHRHPDRLVVAADVRGGRVVVRGWREVTELSGKHFLRGLDGMPLAGILVTDVDREGRMEGVDVGAFGRWAEVAPFPLLAAGGISSLEDIIALARVGVAGAVLGMALYSGAIDGRAAAREFGP